MPRKGHDRRSEIPRGSHRISKRVRKKMYIFRPALRLLNGKKGKFQHYSEIEATGAVCETAVTGFGPRSLAGPRAASTRLVWGAKQQQEQPQNTHTHTNENRRYPETPFPGNKFARVGKSATRNLLFLFLAFRI